MKRDPWEGCYDRGVPVLVMKVGDYPLHHGTLGVIRSFGRVGVPVYGTREPALAPAAASRYLCGRTAAPFHADRPDACIAQLKGFQRDLGRPLAVVPTDDRGALLLAENAAALGSGLLLPAQRPDLPRRMASKANHPHLCASAGLAVPETIVVAAHGDAAAVTAFTWPAVVKIAQPWLLPPGVPGVLQAAGAEDVVRYHARVSTAGADVVVQEYIPDEESEDWFYHGYHRPGGEPGVGFTGRKLRSYPPFFGATSYGVSAVNPEVIALAQRLLGTLGYGGIVELEFRYDRRDRRYKLLDVNPRLGAQFQFLCNDAGVDVVRAMHLDVTGRGIPAGRQVEGRTFQSELTDGPAFQAYWRRSAVTPAGWLRQVLGADERAWFSWDDMAPAAVLAANVARRVLGKANRRLRAGAALGKPPLARHP